MCVRVLLMTHDLLFQKSNRRIVSGHFIEHEEGPCMICSREVHLCSSCALDDGDAAKSIT